MPVTPQISVVVPLYNKRRTILRCVESVLDQTLSSFELIVVDDGSTDGSADILAELGDPRIHLIRVRNSGVSAARNRGIAEAAAPLIAFLDADDTWEQCFLEATHGLSIEYPMAGMYATGLRIRLDSGSCVDVTARVCGIEKQGLLTDYMAGLRECSFITSSNIAIPRATLDAVGMFKEGAAIGEDRDLWVRIALKYPIAYDARILSTYHVGDDQRAFERFRTTPHRPAVISTLTALIEDGRLTDSEAGLAKDYIEWHLLDYVYDLVDAGLRGEALRALREGRRYTGRLRLESRLLGLMLPVAPLHLVSRIKGRYRWLPTRVERMRGKDVHMSGRALEFRKVFSKKDSSRRPASPDASLAE